MTKNSVIRAYKIGQLMRLTQNQKYRQQILGVETEDVQIEINASHCTGKWAAVQSKIWHFPKH